MLMSSSNSTSNMSSNSTSNMIMSSSISTPNMIMSSSSSNMIKSSSSSNMSIERMKGSFTVGGSSSTRSSRKPSTDRESLESFKSRLLRPVVDCKNVLQLTCDLLRYGDRRLKFPGTQPVSLCSKNVEVLKSDFAMSQPRSYPRNSEQNQSNVDSSTPPKSPNFLSRSRTKGPKGYLLCEKTDGERHILVQVDKDIYLIDRKSNVFQIHRQPNSTCSSQPNSSTCSRQPNSSPSSSDASIYLLDGELVVDEFPSGSYLMFLIFDAMFIRGRDVTQYNLIERLEFAQEDLQKFAQEDLQEKNVALHIPEELHLYIKDFYTMENLDVVWRMANQDFWPHDTDGLIFTPIEDPYETQTNDRLLKWKPAELNTVDFLVRYKEQGNMGGILLSLYIQNENVLQYFTDIYVGEGDRFQCFGKEMSLGEIRAAGERAIANNLRELEGSPLQEESPLQAFFEDTIWECRWKPGTSTNSSTNNIGSTTTTNSSTNNIGSTTTTNSSTNIGAIPGNNSNVISNSNVSAVGSWVLYKLRDDKEHPNAKYTVDRVIQSINDNISFEELLAVVNPGNKEDPNKHVVDPDKHVVTQVEEQNPKRQKT